MSKKLFIGGISWGTSDDDLRQAFKEYGEVVEAKVIKDQYSGRSRGFGFVTYGSAEAAEEAIKAMNGTELDGRNLRVDFAKERSRGGGGGGYNR